MKKTIEDYIKQDEVFRKALLNQKGGIMKFWAEHPNRDYDADLFDDYENEIVKAYLHENKQNRTVRSLHKDELRRKSLDWYQSKESELKFYVDMKPILNTFGVEISEQVLKYIDIYMVDAYKENHRYKFPKGMPPQDFYDKVLEQYGLSGLALDCLERVLQEYRGKAVRITVKHFFLDTIVHKDESHEWKEVNNLQMEFNMRMFLEKYYSEGGYRKLRQAVKELIDNSTQKLTEEEKRKECRKMAKDEMIKVNQFTRWVNNETYPMEESEEGKLVPLITPKERKWLRNIKYENSPGATGILKLTTMGRYYSVFISILQYIGNIWAAQLLVHGIDMKELEKETGIILSKLHGPMYYVDRIPYDRHGESLIYDYQEAKELLSKIHGEESTKGIDDSEDIDDYDNTRKDKGHNDSNYYGQDYEIFHYNLDSSAIAEAVKTLPRGDVKSVRKFFYTVYLAFDKLHWLTCTQKTKFISWMKFHSGIHFKTKDFKNVKPDDNMFILLPQIIEVFSKKVDDDCYDDYDKFYRKDPQGFNLSKINKGV